MAFGSPESALILAAIIIALGILISIKFLIRIGGVRWQKRRALQKAQSLAVAEQTKTKPKRKGRKQA